jgi:hypothetical protein
MCNWLRDRTLSEKVSLGWSHILSTPIKLLDRRTLKTLADCRAYILALARTRAGGDHATQALLKARNTLAARSCSSHG